MKKENKFLSIGITFLLFFIVVAAFAIASLFSPYDSVSYIVSYGLTLLIFIKLFKDKMIEDIKHFNKDLKKSIKLIFPISLIFISLVYLINYLIYKYTGTEATNQLIAIEELKSSPLLLSFHTIILAPIVEEFIFKLGFKHHNKKRFLDILIIAILFTLFHFYPENNPLAYLYLISYFILSIGISIPFYKTDNILLSTLVHIINNLINVMIILF